MQIFTLLLLIITSTLVGLFGIKPLYESVRVVRAEQIKIDGALGKTKEIISAVVKLREEIDSIPIDDINKLEVLIPSSIDEIRFLNMLNSMAIKHSISLTGLNIINKDDTSGNLRIDKIDTINDKSKISNIDVGFFTTASYGAFKSFLKDLEQSLMLIDVNSIMLSVPENENRNLRNVVAYEYDVVLSTHTSR